MLVPTARTREPISHAVDPGASRRLYVLGHCMSVPACAHPPEKTEGPLAQSPWRENSRYFPSEHCDKSHLKTFNDTYFLLSFGSPSTLTSLSCSVAIFPTGPTQKKKFVTSVELELPGHGPKSRLFRERGRALGRALAAQARCWAPPAESPSLRHCSCAFLVQRSDSYGGGDGSG